MAAGSALDRIGAAECPELVADGEDVVLLVGGEADVVHARAVATGHRGVVHGGFPAHPGGVDRSLFVLDVLGDPEAERLHEVHRPRHVGGHLVEVIQPHQLAGAVQVVPPRQALDVLGGEEELVGEAQGVDHPDRIADALGEAVRLAPHLAAELGVEGHGLVEVLGRADAVREGGDGGDRPLSEHEVVMDELLGRAEVDRGVVLLRDVQTQHVDVELPRGGEVGDDEFHVGAPEDVGRR